MAADDDAATREAAERSRRQDLPGDKKGQVEDDLDGVREALNGSDTDADWKAYIDLQENSSRMSARSCYGFGRRRRAKAALVRNLVRKCNRVVAALNKALVRVVPRRIDVVDVEFEVVTDEDKRNNAKR